MINKEEKTDIILRKIEEGESVSAILRANDMPSRDTFYRWLKEDDKLADNYARATSLRADHVFDEIFEIADDSRNDYVSKLNKEGDMVEVLNTEHVQRSKLRIDARKWALGKMNPSKYGDKIGLEHSGEIRGDKINLNVSFENFSDE